MQLWGQMVPSFRPRLIGSERGRSWVMRSSSCTTAAPFLRDKLRWLHIDTNDQKPEGRTVRQGSTERAEEGGTLGERADLAAAMSSRLDQAWYAVAGSDPHAARLHLARARLSGVLLWSASRDALAAPSRFDVVVLGEPETLGERDLAAALEDTLDALAPDGVLLLLPGPEPDELPAGAALMDTHDGEGLKIVCSAVVRRSGNRARLLQHWMVARDEQGVEMFSEQHTIYLHTPGHIEAALRAAGLETIHHPSAAFPRGLWRGMRYSHDITQA